MSRTLIKGNKVKISCVAKATFRFCLPGALLVFVVSARASANSFDRFCHRVGGLDENVCDVPVGLLVSNGEFFNGKLVQVRGFLAAMKPPKDFEQREGYVRFPLLFSGEEAFSMSNTVDSVAIELPEDTRLRGRLLQLNNARVLISGRYLSKGVVTIGAGGDWTTAGRIIEVYGVGSGYPAWGSSSPVPASAASR